MDKIEQLLQVGWCAGEAPRLRAYKRDDGRLLVVLVSTPSPVFGGTTWNALAIETNAVIDDFLNDHAHHMIGDYDSLLQAQTACESYAEMWVKKARVAKAEQCGCEDVEPAAPRRSKRRPSAVASEIARAGIAKRRKRRAHP